MLRQRFELAVRAGLGRSFISDVKRGKIDLGLLRVLLKSAQ
jgi:hypothetical protein